MCCDARGRPRPELVAYLALCVAMLLPCGAAAQNSDPVAETLFREGRDLIKEERWEEGCAKLRISMDRYPAPSTLMNLALCAEHRGELATAWAMYKQALALNLETAGEERKEQLRDVGESAVERLEPELPRLFIELTSPVSGATASEEGAGALPIGSAVPLDPGRRSIVVTAPGYEREKRDVELVRGEMTTLRVELRRAVQDDGHVEIAGDDASMTPIASPEPSSQGTPGSLDGGGPPPWVWVTGGAGLVAAGFSIGFAIDATNAASELESICGSDLVCDEDLTFDPDPTNDRKNRSTGLSVGLGAGALVLITTSVLGIVLASDESAAWVPWLGPREAGGTAIWRF